MSTRKRIERLEARAEGQPKNTGQNQALEAYFAALENVHRKKAGLDPLPIPESEPNPELEAYLESLAEYRRGGHAQQG